MKKFGLVFVAVAISLIAGCRLNDTDVIEANLPQLTTDSIRALGVNDIIIKLKKYGELTNDNWGIGTSQMEFITLAGLWIGMEQDGTVRGNIISEATLKKSNYTSNWSNKKNGVFHLDGLTTYSSNNWPVTLGAPITSSGKPLVYGDAMCWNALFSDTSITSPPVLAKPIKGLRVTQALYGYQRSDLRYVMFIRYSITNTTSKVWNNVYLGFYSDTDIGDGFDNQTAYDSTRSLTYTYRTGYNNIAGYTFLNTPGNVGVTSSRIMRKNSYIDPDFGEYTMSTPVQILYALKGLSNSGLPMMNPVTKQVTKFAFTGDAVRNIGWLDTPVDTRNIISSGPFTLNAGETTTITVVWVSTNGINLADAITNIKEKIDLIRSNSSLWLFP